MQNIIDILSSMNYRFKIASLCCENKNNTYHYEGEKKKFKLKEKSINQITNYIHAKKSSNWQAIKEDNLS